MKTHLFASLCVGPAILLSANGAQAQVTLSAIGRYNSGIFDRGATEISAYDPISKQLFVTNGATEKIDVITLADPTAPALGFSIDLPQGANSVAFHGGILAAAVEGPTPQAPGQVLFFNSAGEFLNGVTVGALPDMVTFTPDGQKVLVANEGEPNEDYTVDPEGSVSVVDLSQGVAQARVNTLDFQGFNRAPLDPSVRIFGLNATVAQDLEPEYIAVAPDSKTAWVTLQENNALGVVDLVAEKITAVVGLGFKDYGRQENRLDASNKDGGINIANYPGLYGMYQPDAIAAYGVNGETYLVTANEGDARLRPTGDDAIAGLGEGDLFNEETRIAKLTLDPEAFPNGQALQQDSVLGRLKVTNTLGDRDGDGDYDALYSYGARSFSIWNTQGEQLFDSGSQFAYITAAYVPNDFNGTNDENGSFDDRSDDKGAEPEGVAIGRIGDHHYGFIGLERVGGIMVYDITDPRAPFFVTYANTRDFNGDPETGMAGDLAPEGLLFIPQEESPNGENLLVVSYEVSGSIAIFQIQTP